MPPIFRQLLLAAATFPTLAHASAWQNLDALDAQVAHALAASGEAAQPVDRRLRLAACSAGVTVERAGPGAVAVRCPSPNWRIRVLLIADTTSRVTALGPVVMRRGDPVTIMVRSPGFTASTQGTALADARAGDRVTARIEGQKVTIAGRVIDGQTIDVF